MIQCECGYIIPPIRYMQLWYRTKTMAAHYEKVYLNTQPIKIFFNKQQIERIYCICGVQLYVKS